MKKRILFVDDERNILDGLRNRLRHQRQKWDMVFVESGRDALESLEREPFDVIVTDMRMPGMDGTALLQRVRQAYPAVARIVLSGHADEGAMLRAMVTAHQYLPKPCDPGVLENIINRVCGLQDILNDEPVKQVIGKIGSLPSQPAVYSELMAAIADDRSSTQAIAQILKKDSALCSQILHVVNSAYFRLPHPILAPEDAVVYLGMGTVRQLALVAEIFRQAHAEPVFLELSLADLQKHTLLAGGIASALFSNPEQKEAAFVAALLHDIGKILLVTELPDRTRQIIQAMKTSGETMYESEKKLFGATHAEIGAYLMGLWQIPFAIVEAIANHHAPDRVDGDGRLLAEAVHLADQLANEQMGAGSGQAGTAPAEIPPLHLERLGGAEKLPEWREIAGKIARSYSPLEAIQG